jgi:hypothetical protein
MKYLSVESIMSLHRCMALLVACFLATGPLTGSSAPAPEVAGLVERVSGQARLNGVPLRAHTTLFHGDRVSTAAAGRVLLALGKGTQAMLAPSSEVVVYKSEGGIKLSLRSGRLLLRQEKEARIQIELAGSTILLSAGESHTTLCEVAYLADEVSVACPAGEARLWTKGPETSIRIATGRRVSRQISNEKFPASERKTKENSSEKQISAKSLWQVGIITAAAAAAVLVPLLTRLGADSEKPAVSPSGL